MTPDEMVSQVLKRTRRWRFDVIAVGYPGVVRDNAPATEPVNLGPGWVGFDFRTPLAHPVRMINDAAMQAMGNYVGGTLLFLGLGTGLGTALIVDGTVVPLELGHLSCHKGHDYEYELGERGRRRLGGKKWKARVAQVVEGFRQALLPDDIVLGGGNTVRLKRLPPHTRRGHHSDAFHGGRRLWERRDPPGNGTAAKRSKAEIRAVRPSRGAEVRV
jgi:polyphosphate glucokinase